MLVSCKLFSLNEYLFLVVSPFEDFFIQLKDVSEFSELQVF